MYHIPHDKGDRDDNMKWDFDESKLGIYLSKNDGYYYLAENESSVPLLEKIRDKVTKMADYIYDHMDEFPKKARPGLELFVMIHGENELAPSDIPDDEFVNHYDLTNGYTSRIMYSEIPKKTAFEGINKPRKRFNDPYAPSIGKDGTTRSVWRHMLLQLPKSKKLTKKLSDLIIHELAHTAANHVNWRPDDHGNDFNLYENILKKVWKKI